MRDFVQTAALTALSKTSAMLSATALAGSATSAAKYYSVGDYYSKGDAEGSAWIGAGAARLGLAGDVNAKTLENVLGGHLPGHPITTWKPGDDNHRLGWDFTFSAPKSVSVAALVGGDDRLVDAHEQAAKEGFQFLERFVAARVRTKEGIETKLTGNAVAAQFTEFSSRALEAQLHTHTVIANATWDEDRGKWVAVESRPMFVMKMAAGQVYRNALARLTRGLGYEINADDRTGFFEISGVSASLMKEHSTRSEQIEAHAKAKGDESPEAKAVAALVTRDDKQKSDVDTLQKDWRTQAGPAETRALDTLIKSAAERDLDPAAPRDIAKAAWFGIAHGTAGEAVVEHGNIARYALQVSVGDTTLSDIEAKLDEHADNGRYIDATHKTGGRPIYDGRLTDRSLRDEAKFALAIEEGRGGVRRMLRSENAERRLGRYRLTIEKNGQEAKVPLKGEQMAAGRTLLSEPHRAQFIQGVAGAGKSTLVAALKEATPLRQHIAVAPLAKAAQDLGSDAGIEAMTVAKLLASGGNNLDRGAVVYVDEASMLGTRAALRLLELAEQRDFRLAFFGDEAQLEAIEQGKPHGLVRMMGATAAELQESRRHKTDAVKSAVTAARTGDVAGVFAAVGEDVHALDADDLVEHVAEHWASRPDRDKSRVMSLDNQTRVGINAAIRDRLVKEGVVSRGGSNLEILSPTHLTEAEKKFAAFYEKGAVVVFHRPHKGVGAERGDRFEVTGVAGPTVSLKQIYSPKGAASKTVDWRPGDGPVRAVTVYDRQDRTLAPGDIIQWRQNAPELALKNGMEGVVDEIDGDKAKIAFKSGETKSVDLEAYPFWDHGYALTVYKAQGATFGEAILAAPAKPSALLDQKSLQTAISRASDAVSIWTTDPEKLEKLLADAPGGKTSALEARDETPTIVPEEERSSATPDAEDENRPLQDETERSGPDAADQTAPEEPSLFQRVLETAEEAITESLDVVQDFFGGEKDAAERGEDADEQEAEADQAPPEPEISR